jgi:hypothetical protein
MITWVDEECRSWGAHKRWLIWGKEGWPERSILGRLIAEGPGAGHETFGSRVPVKDPPVAYASISHALQLMALTHELEKPIQIVHAHYVDYGMAKQKAPKLGVSLKQYWNMLHAAHAFIAGCNVPRETDSCTRSRHCA